MFFPCVGSYTPASTIVNVCEFMLKFKKYLLIDCLVVGCITPVLKIILHKKQKKTHELYQVVLYFQM